MFIFTHSCLLISASLVQVNFSICSCSSTVVRVCPSSFVPIHTCSCLSTLIRTHSRPFAPIYTSSHPSTPIHTHSRPSMLRVRVTDRYGCGSDDFDRPKPLPGQAAEVKMQPLATWASPSGEPTASRVKPLPLNFNHFLHPTELIRRQ